MNNIKHGVKNIIWEYYLFRGMTKIDKSNPLASDFRSIITDTIALNSAREERKALKKIEKLRKVHWRNPTEIKTPLGSSPTATISHFSLAGTPQLLSLLLFKIIRQFKPLNGLELGTGIGISASYAATAMHFNGNGQLTTIEGVPEIAAIAQENFHQLGTNNIILKQGAFRDVLPAVLSESTGFDYVFLDGDLSEGATWEYFEMLRPHLAPNALLIVNGISLSEEMKQVWRRIQDDADIPFAFDLEVMGVCVAKQTR